MAQEVRTVEQQTPATTDGAGQRIPRRPVFLPPADIYETKDSIVVLAEMPGVAPDGVDITLERRVLTIRGRSAANEHAGYQRVYNEYRRRRLRARFHAFGKHRPRPHRGDAQGRRLASRPAEGGNRKGEKDRAQSFLSGAANVWLEQRVETGSSAFPPYLAARYLCSPRGAASAADAVTKLLRQVHWGETSQDLLQQFDGAATQLPRSS